MNLDYFQIHDMDKRQLFPYLREFIEMKQYPGEGYQLENPPLHWFMSLNGDIWADVDLTEGDCGNSHRAAAFVHALMWNAGQEGVRMRLELIEPGDKFDASDEWITPVWQGWAGRATACADSPELALLRAYLKLKVP